MAAAASQLALQSFNALDDNYYEDAAAAAAAWTSVDEITYCGHDPSVCDASGLICVVYDANPHPRDRQLFDFDSIWHSFVVILQLTTYTKHAVGAQTME